jgi:hypothetical protein
MAADLRSRCGAGVPARGFGKVPHSLLLTLEKSCTRSSSPLIPLRGGLSECFVAKAFLPLLQSGRALFLGDPGFREACTLGSGSVTPSASIQGARLNIGH